MYSGKSPSQLSTELLLTTLVKHLTATHNLVVLCNPYIQYDHILQVVQFYHYFIFEIHEEKLICSQVQQMYFAEIDRKNKHVI